jgi:FtsP/CotA-like multicopper oxidase with cupredoxin domain
MSTDIRNIRRTNPDGMKGHTDVTSGTEHEEGEEGGRLGRRKFLILGGTGAAVLAGTAGAARALITAGGTNPSPRSQNPVGIDPAVGRALDAVGAAPGGVFHLALAGTDGWVTFPLSMEGHPADIGGARGVAPIDPYFPDTLADPPNTTTYAFCFRNVTGLNRSQVAAQKGRTQICAPIIYSTVGQELWIELTNLGLALRPDLIDGHTLHWHGFRNAIPFYDGVPESSIAVAIDHDFTYVYRPQDAGTYMYHCHFEDVEHVTMGMHGIVFVKPNPADKRGLITDPDPLTQGAHAQKAYGVGDGDETGETGYDREFAIMLNEIDSRAHFGDAHIQETNWTDFHADLWTFNGRAYPDTLEPNGTRDGDGNLLAQTWNGTYDGDGNANLVVAADHRLANNPLSSLVQCAPGERVLIRFANLGFLNHTIVFPGLSVDVLGRDARYVPQSAQRTATDSIQIGPGESRDVFFTAPAVGTYAFYDRGMSHYRGSSDGSDAWVGGQRSHIVVEEGLGAQLKPNGWAGEAVWDGEFPVPAVHDAPSVTASAVRVSTGPQNQRGKFISGSVLHDTNNPGVTVADVWWVRAVDAPANDSSQWHLMTTTGQQPSLFNHVRVAGPNPAATSKYWVLARDSSGVYSTPVLVEI